MDCIKYLITVGSTVLLCIIVCIYRPGYEIWYTFVPLCRHFFKVNINRLHVDCALFPSKTDSKKPVSQSRKSEEGNNIYVSQLSGI